MIIYHDTVLYARAKIYEIVNKNMYSMHKTLSGRRYLGR